SWHSHALPTLSATQTRTISLFSPDKDRLATRHALSCRRIWALPPHALRRLRDASGREPALTGGRAAAPGDQQIADEDQQHERQPASPTPTSPTRTAASCRISVASDESEFTAKKFSDVMRTTEENIRYCMSVMITQPMVSASAIVGSARNWRAGGTALEAGSSHRSTTTDSTPVASSPKTEVASTTTPVTRIFAITVRARRFQG